MKNNRLGNSGLYVSEFSLGAMIFGEQTGRSTPEDEAIKMVHSFMAHGGTHIDTANVYGGGASERVLAKALAEGKRDKVTLASKVRFGSDPQTDMGAGLSRKFIMDQVEKSLARLNTDVIDLYYMHGWDPHSPIEESLRAFDDLVREGKVRYIGVSNFTAWQVMQSLGLSDHNSWARFTAAQYQYSLVVRDIEREYRSLFQEHGLGCMAWGPLGGGFLSGKYSPDSRPTEGRISQTDEAHEEAWNRRANERNWRILAAVRDVAMHRGASVPQIALAWIKSKPWVSSIIIGARTIEQLEDNMGAADIELNEAEITRLDEVSVLPDQYPYRMMQTFGMDTEE